MNNERATPLELDFEGAAREAGWAPFTDKYGANCYRDTADGQTWACKNWQELCEAFDIEADQIE